MGVLFTLCGTGGGEAQFIESLAWQGKTPVKNSKFKIVPAAPQREES
jgi:hypothetical protein